MTAVIDATIFAELKEAMGADFIGELIDTYCEETPRLVADLQQALAQGNADLFRRSAHSIKSSSASFGALEFAAQARELEMIGKAGDLSNAASQAAHLGDEYQQVEHALRELQHGA
jgi:HPt (histidine-containing phosphotransfer) domain-containing protein